MGGTWDQGAACLSFAPFYMERSLQWNCPREVDFGSSPYLIPEMHFQHTSWSVWVLNSCSKEITGGGGRWVRLTGLMLFGIEHEAVYLGVNYAKSV